MSTAVRLPALPSRLATAVWRGSELGTARGAVLASGWAALDRELPGGGWPCGSLVELLAPAAARLEWRLLGPALRRVAADGGSVLLIGPPLPPYLPGLRAWGIEPAQLLWVRAQAPAERLWAVEQLLRADDAGAIVAWLPQVRADALRRLHAHAQGGRGLLFVWREPDARQQASPAPLRVQLELGAGWNLRARLLKRRGPAFDGVLELDAPPAGLDAVWPARTRPAPDAAPAVRGGADAHADAVDRAVSCSGA